MSAPIFEEDDQSAAPPRKRTPTWAIATLILGGGLVVLCPLLIVVMMGVQQAREAARRSQAMGHLKKVGLATHEFHEVNEHLPPLIVADEFPEQAGYHSWMTDLLPYLYELPLHEQIDRGHPWNSTENQAPMQAQVPVFQNPQDPSRRTTPEGYGVSDFAANSRLIDGQHRRRFADITDDQSTTILVGSIDAGHRAWGDPGNHRDPAAGIAGGPTAFGSYHPNVTLFAMADGSLRTINQKIDQDVLRRLADPAGGEPVEPMDFIPR